MNPAVKHLRTVDERLKKIIDGYMVEHQYQAETVFEDMVSCILDMQIHHRGKATRYKRLKHLLDYAPITHKNLFTIGDEGLKTIKMSGQKYTALLALCQYWEENDIINKDWDRLTDSEVKNALLTIKGIGEWTADMILLFNLNRPDIMPLDDFHLKKAMMQVYELQDDKTLKKEMKLIASNWAPYRSLAVKYLLAFKKHN